MGAKLEWGAAVVLTVAMATPGVAQVYRCDGPDGPIFTQTPCAEDAVVVPIAPSAPQAGSGGTDWDDPSLRRGRELLQQDRLDRVADRRRVAVGMSERQVRRAWGEPDRINRTIHATGNREQWVYRRGQARTQYVHFRDGTVSSVSGPSE